MKDKNTTKNRLDTSMLPLARGTRRVSAEELKGVTHLRLRWKMDARKKRFVCVYELVLALDKNDIRREVYKDGEDTGKRLDTQVVELGRTTRSVGHDPCVPGGEHLYYDAPYRDGAHAKWDAAKLGGLPIYVVAMDGQYLAQEAVA